MDWLSDPPARSILALGAAASLLCVAAAFAVWTLADRGFADDDYLWWTAAAGLAPLAASAGVAALERARPAAAPAVGVALVVMLGSLGALALG